MNEEALLLAIAIIAGTLVVLSLLIVVNKAIREARAGHRRRWRRALEPGLQRYIAAREPGTRQPQGVAPDARASRLPHFVQVPSRGAGREAAIDFLLEYSEVVKGESLERITAGLEELGQVSEDIARLDSRSWWHRASAADRLGLSRSTRATEALTIHLEDRDEDVRLRAARALGMIGGQAAIQPLVVALTLPSRWSTLRVAEILSGMGPRVEGELVRAWAGMPRLSRLATLDILGRMRIPASAAFLQDRLVDEDPDIRARAAHALGQIGDPTAYRGLVRAMRDPEWPVRAMSAKALGRLRAPEAIDALAGGLQDRQWWVRSNSAEALRDFGERGVRALLATLEVPDPFARQQAILMLEQTGLIDRWAADLPGAGADAQTARAGLKRLIELGQTGRLEDLAQTHADPSVRAGVASLLPALSRRSAGQRA